jgi:hypothetical protein
MKWDRVTTIPLHNLDDLFNVRIARTPTGQQNKRR